MESLFVQMTEKCMLKCRYCFYETKYLQSDGRKKNYLQVSEIIKIVSDLKIKHVIVTGGDPLFPAVYEDTLCLINTLSREGIGVDIDTSLAIQDITKIDELVKANIQNFFISCDSTKKSIHNNQRGKWDLTMKGIRRLIEKRAPVVINCTLTKNNAFQVKEIWNFFLNLGVIDVDFNIAYIPRDHPLFKELSCETMNAHEKTNLLEDLIWCAKQSNDYERKLSHVILQARTFFDNMSFMDSKILNCHCAMGNKILIMDSEGNIKPCFHLSEVWSQKGRSIEKVFFLINKIKKKPFSACRGKHCQSLFAIESFWR